MASPVIAVRTDKPIPKDMQFACMKEIGKISAERPFTIGKVLVQNILNTGCNIILAGC
jgi:Uncharacterized protein with conserved CXXC pairs